MSAYTIQTVYFSP